MDAEELLDGQTSSWHEPDFFVTASGCFPRQGTDCQRKLTDVP
jgi:hypothetical protein